MKHITHEVRAGTSLSMTNTMMVAGGVSKEQFSQSWGEADGITR